MRNNKYIPLVIVIIIGVIIFPLLMGGDSGKYVVSFEDIKRVTSKSPYLNY